MKDVPPIFGIPNSDEKRLAVDEEGNTCEILGVARYQVRGSEDLIIQSPQSLLDASELDIIKNILRQKDIFAWFFDFMLDAAIGPRPRNRELDILCALPRSAVGLDPKEKPGDFDIVILPRSSRGYYLKEIMALEVKILRSRQHGRDKHPRPSGQAQAKGLLRDGFPFVGMLHIIVCEPSPKDSWQPMNKFQILNDRYEADKLSDAEPIDTINIDTTERHFGRMQRYVDGTSIGAMTISLLLDQSGTKIIGRDLFSREIRPTRNETVNLEMLKILCHIAMDTHAAT